MPSFWKRRGKAVINESVRGADIFAMVDVTNYDFDLQRQRGFTNHMVSRRPF